MRDSTAITVEETVIFSMPQTALLKIKNHFEEIY
jgi:hypothetical protein